MTSVVDEKQCQWCGTKSPAEAVRCDLCRLPFDRVVPPPRNWGPSPSATAPGESSDSAQVAPLEESGPSATTAPARPVSLADVELEVPAWLAVIRAPADVEVPSQAVAPPQEQLPVYGRPAAVARTGPGRRRRSRPLRRLMIWVVSIGLLTAFLLLAPDRIGL
jgi:hypothetical protein